MALYVWKGKNRYGDIVQGERTANSLEDVAGSLKREQITIFNVVKKRSELQIPFLKREKVKLKELAVYSRQLSVLIDANLPLIQSLNVLSEQIKNKYFSQVIRGVREDVEAGSTLNQAKRKYPKVFDNLYCNLISSGEQSGSLDIVLQRLAEYIEKIVKLRSQVKQAMVYPLAIMTFAIVVSIFLMWKVVPVFSTLFVELGANLPIVTVVVVSISNIIQKYLLYIFLSCIGFFILFKYLKGTRQGRQAIDKTLLRVPLFGPLMKKVAISRITRTLSTLLSGGVPILESLKITSSTSGNAIVENSVMEARKSVAEGDSLTNSLRETSQFPLMVTQMINVGETSGTLDEMLNKISDFYDDEVSASVASLLSLLEPILLITVGLLIGTIVISMYLPIFSLIQQF
ncbi:MAG: type II secretion system F family protein [Candidatus Aminicenantaceae bacterium]